MPTESAKTIPGERFSRTRDDDRSLAALAERQYGVVGRRQLVEMGWSEGAIQKRIRGGRLHRLHAGVYAVGHRLIPREGRWMAAVLASGPDAVLSHWSAAALWMIRPNLRTRIDVTVPHRSRSSKLIRRHISQVPDDERTVEEGIPVTSVPRTIFDLAATEDVDVVKELLREAEYRRLWDRLSLPDLINRYPGKRGVRKVQAALERLKEEPVGRKRSPLEKRFAPFLRHHRLPLPRFNDWIDLDDKRYRVDCHWPGTGQIVELDGWDGHGTRSAFRDDRARDRRLRVAGYAVTRITWNQLDDEPEAIAADLRALLPSAAN
ncbi:MAG TPA: type IV toxin-antitoxin system AbiEi family antitoxin domain-containing protein [Solirubrobacterales bacterium]|nr:type IV toxin-antitoxin system AbiEi family antitoxin domain-containing protein [Solirubrobacterales bacterium]